jgi:hypothetical protein
MNSAAAQGRTVFWLMAGLIAIWAFIGWNDLSQQTQAGFDTNGNHVVTRVYAASPAESAGLQKGDVLTHFDAVTTEDAATIARQPRKKEGDVRRLTLEREGESMDLDVAYDLISTKQVRLAQIKLIVGCCFLLFPLLAFSHKPGEATRILVVMGTGLSMAFFPSPYVADYGIRSLTSAVSSAFVLTGVAALLHFLLVFPRKRPWMNRSFARKVIYFPAILLWFLIAYRVLFTPPSTGALNGMTNFMAGIIMIAYLLLSLFRVLRNFSQTDRTIRKELALNSMLLGTVAGMLPATMAQLTAAFSPQSGLPGQEYYFVSLALIPLTWARSASRSCK